MHACALFSMALSGPKSEKTFLSIAIAIYNSYISSGKFMILHGNCHSANNYVALVHSYICMSSSGTDPVWHSHTHTHAGMAIECVIKTRMPHQYTSS